MTFSDKEAPNMVDYLDWNILHHCAPWIGTSTFFLKVRQPSRPLIASRQSPI